MGLIMYCHDCDKKLIKGIHNAWGHSLFPGKVLCDNCDHKYDSYRRANYFKTLDKVHDNLEEMFRNLATPKEEEIIEKEDFVEVEKRYIKQ